MAKFALYPRGYALLGAALFALLSLGVRAQNDGSADSASAPDLSRLSQVLGAEPDSVQETAMDGLYEVLLGSQILYLSADGRFVIQGQIMDLQTSQNLTENRQQSLRAEQLAALDSSELIVFSPEGETKHTVTVFTDIDCGYCRKLHQEMSTYNDQGIAIRYAAFPRAGLQSDSYNKAVSAWCADDPQEAMTTLKLGGSVAPKTCENPVGEHYDLGQRLGVRGTPSIFLDNGRMIPGYVPAERLAAMLTDLQKSN